MECDIFMKKSLKTLSMLSLVGVTLSQAPMILAANTSSGNSDEVENVVSESTTTDAGTETTVETTESTTESTTVETTESTTVETTESITESTTVETTESETTEEKSKDESTVETPHKEPGAHYPTEMKDISDQQIALETGRLALQDEANIKAGYNAMDIRYDEANKSYSFTLRKDGVSTAQLKGQDKPQEFDLETMTFGYFSEQAADFAARRALLKDSVNNDFEINEKDGRFYYVLKVSDKAKDDVKPEDTEKEQDTDKEIDKNKDTDKDKDVSTEDKKPSKVDKKATEKSFDFDTGFETKEDAIKQAEALVKNSEINKGYNISMGADGKYYIQLTPQDTKTEGVERKEIKPSVEKETSVEREADKKESDKLPETGEVGALATIGVGFVSLLGGMGALLSRKLKK